MVDFSSVQPLQDAATAAEQKATSEQAAGASLPDQLRQAVNERFANSPLETSRNTALSGFLQSGADTRASVAKQVAGGTILSPTQQQQIFSANRASAIIPLVGANDLLQGQFGNISDIIGAGTNAYNANTQADLGRATVARTAANSALDNLYKQAQLQISQEGLGLQRGELTLKQQAAQRQLDFGKLLSGLLNGGSTDTTNAPKFTPTTGVGTVAVDDSTGTKWTYTQNGWQSSGEPSNTSTAGSSSALNNLLAQGISMGAVDPSTVTALQGVGAVSKPQTPAQKQNAISASSALHSLSTITDLIQKDPNSILRANTPVLNLFGSSATYNTAAREIADVITRSRTGAQANPSEIEFYKSQLPLPTDDAATIQYKIQQFTDLFNQIKNESG